MGSEFPLEWISLATVKTTKKSRAVPWKKGSLDGTVCKGLEWGERNEKVSLAAGKWLWGHHHGLAAATFLHPTSQTCSNHRKVNSEQSALLGREGTLLPDAICVVHYLHRFCICLSCSFIFCLQNSLFLIVSSNWICKILQSDTRMCLLTEENKLITRCELTELI